MIRLLLAASITALIGCATAPIDPSGAAELFDDAAFEAHRLRADPHAVFELSPAMHQYVLDSVLPAVRARGREGLIDALYSSQHLRLAYDGYVTRNASEAFDARAGNCLSLVIMTSAFARAIGMDVRYQRSRAEDIWVREGDLVQLVGHVNLSLGQSVNPALRASSSVGWLTIDFLPLDDAQRERVQTIGERRVVAMYFNNKAAEALATGQHQQAYWWAKASIEHDVAYASAYNTLAVVLSRNGHVDKAEAALRAALRIEPDNPQALHNLADALRTLGRVDEAHAAELRLQRVQPYNPMASYKAGRAAFQAGDYSRARWAFQHAARLAPDDDEFQLMLGLTLLHLGDKPAALEHLDRARELTRSTARAGAYAAKIRLAVEAFSKAGTAQSH